jgi:hypothetical protein
MRIAAALLILAPQSGPVQVDEKAGTVSFAAVVVKPDLQPRLEGFVEYVLVNKGGKDYESLFRADLDAGALYEGLKKIGAKPGAPPADAQSPPSGGKLRIRVEWKEGGESRKEPVESFVLDTKTGKPMEPLAWVFTGSKEGFVPELERTDLLVKANRNLVALIQHDPTVLVMNPAPDPGGRRYKGNRSLMPPEGTSVTFVVEAAK